MMPEDRLVDRVAKLIEYACLNPGFARDAAQTLANKGWLKDDPPTEGVTVGNCPACGKLVAVEGPTRQVSATFPECVDDELDR